MEYYRQATPSEEKEYQRWADTTDGDKLLEMEGIEEPDPDPDDEPFNPAPM